ncbi:histone acetyltransferase type B catalytic subunit isoform X3 [Manihot esculenta]|uniref:histone acetyltransferase type B catalytic subunit isoform X3 n=1 Tax=Manihot esculenta TaxID=3983 RepID=UPI001CC3A0D5|nr:histone acetyltransferase type B catalytic subunit isoform X3 [Manihot esculenta]
MGQKQQPPTDPTAEHKKRRRVGFSNIDAGIEAKDCIKIYLVSSKEQVGASENYCIDPVDLNGFFDEDGKIYGYQGLKITIWISSITFHAYADITYQSKSDGGKGITELKSSLQVVRMVIGNEGTGHLYSRLIPLVLLLVDGSNPIDVTDPGWELYVLVQEINDEQGDIQHRVLGFTAVYRFYHYPDKTRLRLSQILVLPPYQHKGYGRRLVEVVNNVAISEDVYDLTVEEPLDYFQHVRTCIDVQRLLVFSPIQDAINSAVSNLKQGKLSKKAHVPRFMPPSTAIEDVRKTLKINRKQFLQCWEVLIYLGLDPADKCMEDFVTIISNRVKADILGKDSGNGGKQVIEVPSDYSAEMSFVMFRTGNVEGGSLQMDENQTNQREQLQQLVDARIKEIQSIAQKLRPV